MIIAFHDFFSLPMILLIDYFIQLSHIFFRVHPVSSYVHVSETVRIGAFILSPVVKSSFSHFFSFSGDRQPEWKNLKLHNGMYYGTDDIFNPEVGDTRVQFYYAGYDGEIVSFHFLCSHLEIIQVLCNPFLS